MTRLTRLCRAVGVGIAVTTASLAMTQVAHAQLPPPKIQPAQAAIQVPAGNVPYLLGKATGSQNYQCTVTNNTSTWKFIGPEARLVTGGQDILHSAGPNGPTQPKWEAVNDHSAVFGAKKTGVPSPTPGAIDWLLLSATPVDGAPKGLLTDTTFIQRVNTTGGVTPTRACTDGEFERVPYTADYYFYRAAGKPSSPGKPGA